MVDDPHVATLAARLLLELYGAAFYLAAGTIGTGAGYLSTFIRRGRRRVDHRDLVAIGLFSGLFGCFCVAVVCHYSGNALADQSLFIWIAFPFGALGKYSLPLIYRGIDHVADRLFGTTDGPTK